MKRREEIGEHEVASAQWFVGKELKGLWNEAHFRNTTFLYNHNCKGRLRLGVSMLSSLLYSLLC